MSSATARRRWNGVDVVVNSRLRPGLVLQIGSSTGRSVVDNCAVAAKVPELLNPALTNPSPFTSNIYQLANACRKEESWQTQVRGFATYTVPKLDVLLSGIFRFQPNSTFGFGATPEGNSTGLSANYALTSGQTVNLLPPGQVFGPRINQVDVRFGKILDLGKKRTSIAVDLLTVQREHRHRIPAELRRRVGLSDTDDHPESPLRQVQRDR
jgi:hypothetical protein